MGLPKRKLIFQLSIFRGHVSFREGKRKNAASIGWTSRSWETPAVRIPWCAVFFWLEKNKKYLPPNMVIYWYMSMAESKQIIQNHLFLLGHLFEPNICQLRIFGLNTHPKKPPGTHRRAVDADANGCLRIRARVVCFRWSLKRRWFNNRKSPSLCTVELISCLRSYSIRP